MDTEWVGIKQLWGRRVASGFPSETSYMVALSAAITKGTKYFVQGGNYVFATAFDDKFVGALKRCE